MRIKLPILCILAFAAFVNEPATSAPAEPEGAIKKEPKYDSKSPGYAMLVVGAEKPTRIWLVLDGDVMYVDRNANGDLTEPDERVEGKEGQFAVGEIRERDGKIKYPKLVLRIKTDDKGRSCIEANYYYRVPDKYSQTMPETALADRPADALTISINGPLTMGLWDDEFVFPRGKETEIHAWIGTPRGKKFADVGRVDFNKYPDDKQGESVPGIPRDGLPEAVIEFPNPDPKDEPIKITVPLKHWT